MKKVLGVYKRFLDTLKPESYADFSDSLFRNTFSYYSSLILNALVIFVIILLPSLFTLPTILESQFNNIDTFVFSNDFKTSAPIAFPQQHPVIVINYNNQSMTQPAKIILNNNVVYFGLLFKQFVIDLNPYKDAKAKKTEVSNILAFLIILLLPTIALLFYFYFFIKYLIICIAAAIIAGIITAFTKYKVSIKQLINIAVYGISLTIFLDLIFFALGFSFYNIQYLPFMFFLVVGIMKNKGEDGTKSSKKRKAEYLEVKGY